MAKTEKPSAGKASDKKTKKESAAQAKEPKPAGAAQAKGQDEPKVTPRLKETYRNQIVPALMKEFGYKNPMQVPKAVLLTPVRHLLPVAERVLAVGVHHVEEEGLAVVVEVK